MGCKRLTHLAWDISGWFEAILVPGCCNTVEKILCIECLYFGSFLSCCNEVDLKIKGLLINTSDFLARVVVVAFTVYLTVGSSMVDGRTVQMLYHCLHT